MEENKEIAKQQTTNGSVVTERTSTGLAPEEKQAVNEEKTAFRAYYLIYYIIGIVEVLLAFRFVFKLLGANPNSGFVSFIYSLSGAFMAPFSGIFRSTTNQGVETTGVFEPAILIAMAVYALIGWGFAKLIDVITAGKTPSA